MSVTTGLETPAQLVRKRRTPAVPVPPFAPRLDRRQVQENLDIDVIGTKVLIGPHIEGDPEINASYSDTETWAIQVRDPNGDLEALLPTVADLLDVGVTITIDTILYYLVDLERDEDTGTLVTLTFEDAVSWRMRQFSKFEAFSRKRYTRAQAVLKLLQQAGRSPYAPIAYYIPELNDKEAIAPIAYTGSVSVKKGTGADTGYTVKGKPATAAQRAVIDDILTECELEGCSTRVSTAAIMCATQESDLTTTATDGDHEGPFQQSPDWGTETQRRDATQATGLFLAAWRTKHGSLTSAPGDLATDIEAVQASGEGSLYAQWEAEAGQTVSAWKDGGGSVSVDVTTTTIQPYEFSRGSKADGTRESSWVCTGRWADEVRWRRWVQRNTFFFISDNELRASAPDLEINGDEDFLLNPPGYTWNPNQPVTKVTLKVLAERWSVMIGGCVVLKQPPFATPDGLGSRFLVSATDGYMQNPELTVTLSRPADMFKEPAPDTTQSSNTTTLVGGSAPVDRLLAACKTIDEQNRAYVYGGGHGVPLSKITAHEGLDCSSSVSLALYMAGLFDHPDAWVAQEFGGWGTAGVGPDFTVYWTDNDAHVWIQFNAPNSPYARFDTSPHGDGPYGPHLRTQARTDQDRFNPQHWTGK